MDVADATRILDLGCGVGVLGIVAALRRPEARVTLVDSYARAAQCAQRNLAAHGLAERCEVLLTADPLASLSPGYDLVLTNPPYYGHYRISEAFLDTAAKVLVPGGRIVVVTKGVEWHTAAMQQRFGNVQTQEGQGYWVLTSVLRG
jgi:16S rRNA (guanine1207-N2)-methyltransferase